ncbi:MAG: hypothetical protein IJU50_07050 [Lachnospiraceae bacterium]|nr:hypothetical protein [Lachnospiraceae bacterium]
MLYCAGCKIEIRGDKVCCPVCQGKLTGSPEESCFPVQRQRRMSHVLFMKISIFTGIILEVIVLFLCYLLGWPYFLNIMIFAIPLLLADIAVAVYYRSNLIRLITFQSYVGMAVAIWIDLSHTGIDLGRTFMIPILFPCLAAATIILGVVQRLRLDDYVIYLVFNSVLSLLQLLPVFLKTNSHPSLAIISVGIMFILASFVIIFKFRDLKNASSKYLNL